MKKIIGTFLLALFTSLAFSNGSAKIPSVYSHLKFQTENPVSWSYETVKKSADTYDIIITATVDHPWHIYSQNTAKGGPIPTTIKFKPNPLVTVKAGKAKEVGKLEKAKDENMGVIVSYYSDKVQFVQTVTVKGKVKTNVAGSVDYMVCNDQRCLPPTKNSFDLKLQ